MTFTSPLNYFSYSVTQHCVDLDSHKSLVGACQATMASFQTVNVTVTLTIFKQGTEVYYTVALHVSFPENGTD